MKAIAVKPEIKGNIVCRGHWPQVEIVKVWSERDTESILTFGKYFNDTEEAEMFLQTRMFKAILSDVIKGLKDE